MTLEKKVSINNFKIKRVQLFANPNTMSLPRRLLLTGTLEDFSEYLDGENDEGRQAPEEFNTQLVKTLFDINLTVKKVNICNGDMPSSDAIDILYTLNSASNYSAIQKLKP